jgi:hypothetical protein
MNTNTAVAKKITVVKGNKKDLAPTICSPMFRA